MAIYSRGERHELGCCQARPAEALATAVITGRRGEGGEGRTDELQRSTGQQEPSESRGRGRAPLKRCRTQ